MDRVFIYWDNSNIFDQVQQLAETNNGNEPATYYRVRLKFENLFRLAHADRPVEKAWAAGYIPPEMRQLWNSLENLGIKVHLYDRGSRGSGEQETTDQYLQLRMLEDAADHDPNIMVALTGDGAGYSEGHGFYRNIERIHNMGWKIELLSWIQSCHGAMRNWVEQNGVFIPLDDYYKSITFLNSHEDDLTPMRFPTKLDLSQRPVV